jgi:hypothetical protein
MVLEPIDANIVCRSMHIANGLTISGKMGAQVPEGAKFNIEVPPDEPLTLANL